MLRQASKILIALGLSLSCASYGEDLGQILGAASTQELAAIQEGRRAMLSSMLGKSSGPFVEAYVQGKWSEVLKHWGTEVAGTGFASSANGKALLGLILFANGLETTGIEQLFQVSQPAGVSPALLNEWKRAAPGSAPVWKQVQIKWDPEWTKTFGVAARVRATAQQLRSKEDLKTIEQMITETVPDTAERAWLQWQLVTALAIKGEVGEAAKMLGPLMKYKVNPVSDGLMNITAARLLYKRGYLDVAANYYNQVPKSSYYWFEAQEELGWIYIRQNKPEDVLAQTNTFMVTDFGFLVGPETYYLRGLAQLSICDYPNSVKTLMYFKDKFRGRAQQLIEVQSKGPQSVDQLIQAMNHPDLKVETAGQVVSKLPRRVLRDEKIRQLSQGFAALERETALVSKNFAAPAEKWLSEMLAGKLASIKSMVGTRVQALATKELKEIDETLTRMQVLEVEVIQQVDSAAKRLAKTGSGKGLKPTAKKGQTGSRSKDSLTFKTKANEVWFDELANYRVNVKQFCANGGSENEKAN
ncbi:MAG: hypothetical protein KDD43_09850 [Bdellovibrionales bacterium]|nr:hypothetical protein [Bdellovibrionales bacterium]